MKNKTYTFFLKKILKLHNFLYKLISYLSIKREGGLHPKYRLIKYKDFFLNNISETDEVLDIGCGQGALANDIASRAKHVTGIDIVENKIKIAREKYQSSNISFIYGDATKDLTDKKFDIIVLSNVLEHIEHRVDFLKKIKGLATKYLIRVPMYDRDWVPLYKKELGVEWRLDLTHFIEYTRKTFEEEINQAGYQISDLSVQYGEIWAVVKF